MSEKWPFASPCNCTQGTDAGLAHIARLAKLENLGLRDAPLHDRGAAGHPLAGGGGDARRWQAAGDVDPDLLWQGMVVLHPEYGLGKVVALGGSRGERTATIDFASAAGRKKLALAGSDLGPVKYTLPCKN